MALPPNLHLQPLSVDFIDNRLPQRHNAFKDTQARYDTAMHRYVPASITTGSSGKPPLASQEPANSTPTAIGAMRFWASIFDKAVDGLQRSKLEEPVILRQGGYSVRSQKDWDGVYTQLQKAREHYDGIKQGFRGRCKRGLREMVNCSELASRVFRVVPDVDYISPVMAIVEVILEAAHAASEVRDKVTSSLEGKNLEQLFDNIELFLATFPEDRKVEQASIDLVIAIFLAIEESIDFFLKHQVRRAASALFHGGKYQSQLMKRINLIHENSDSLIRQAQNSHISKVRKDMEQILANTWRVALIAQQVREDVKFGVEDLDNKMDRSTLTIVSKIEDSGARIRNTVMQLLDDATTMHQREHEEQMARAQRKHEEELERCQELLRSQQRTLLLAEQAILRQLTPSPSFHPQPWLPQYPIPPSMSTPQTQIAWLPQQPQYSPNKLVAPPIQLYQVPPPQQLTYHWPPGPQAATIGPQTPLSQLLITYLNIPNRNFDISDLKTILDHQLLIPLRQQVRAQQAFNTDEFSSWLTSRGPSQLLIHGDFDRSHPPLISGLSFASATLVDTIREHQKGFISLVYFCGQHTERDDEYAGGMKMVASLIFQLLRQCPQLDVSMAGDMQLIQTGERGCLCNLLARIVRGIPKETTVVFVVDGVVHYENRYFERELLEVVQFVLDMGKHQDNGYSWSSTVKVLVSSPIKTEKVWREFEDGHGTLEMEGLPVVGDSYSQGLEFGLVMLRGWSDQNHDGQEHVAVNVTAVGV